MIQLVKQSIDSRVKFTFALLILGISVYAYQLHWAWIRAKHPRSSAPWVVTGQDWRLFQTEEEHNQALRALAAAQAAPAPNDDVTPNSNGGE